MQLHRLSTNSRILRMRTSGKTHNVKNLRIKLKKPSLKASNGQQDSKSMILKASSNSKEFEELTLYSTHYLSQAILDKSSECHILRISRMSKSKRMSQTIYHSKTKRSTGKESQREGSSWNRREKLALKKKS